MRMRNVVTRWHVWTAGLAAALIEAMVNVAPALADNCSSPSDCAATSGYNEAVAAGGAIIAVLTAIFGSNLAQTLINQLLPGLGTDTGADAAGPPVPQIDQDVISGQEAIDSLIHAITQGGGKAQTVTVNGTTYLLPEAMDHWPPGWHGGGWDTTTVTMPDGTKVTVVDPNSVALVHDVVRPPTTITHTIEPGQVTSTLQGMGLPTRVIDGRTYVLVPENLPGNVTGIGYQTITVNGVEVVDPNQPAFVQGGSPPEGVKGFHDATEGNVDLAHPPTTLTLPDSLHNSMQQAWNQSFPGGRSQEHGGTIFQNPGGGISVQNQGSGTSGTFGPNYVAPNPKQQVVGDVHSHPYDHTEGGHVDVGFSDGDLSSFITGTKVNIMTVQSGNGQYVAVRTNQTPPGGDGPTIRRTFNQVYDNLYDGTNFKDAVDAAQIATANSLHIKLYHGTGGNLTLLNP